MKSYSFALQLVIPNTSDEPPVHSVHPDAEQASFGISNFPSPVLERHGAAWSKRTMLCVLETESVEHQTAIGVCSAETDPSV